MSRVLVLALLAWLGTVPPAAAQTPNCSKGDFEAVVDDAAAALRDLNAKHKPAFQDKLRQLKDKRGWTHDQFMKEGAPFVQDPAIAAFEGKSLELLDTISAQGQEGSESKIPDCALLTDLRGRMATLVQIQTEKWTYMFGKIDAELAK